MTKVSIIIPTLNEEESLDILLRELNEYKENIGEIIVVDVQTFQEGDMYDSSGKVISSLKGDNGEVYIISGFTSSTRVRLYDVDSDADGVTDALDAFPTDPNESLDSDGDGVGDNSDEFPNIADESVDSDGDGVSDAFDGDNNTPEGVAVDGKGNALDVDMDGVADYLDEDPFTARGVQVDAKGRELDSDKDGVANSVDMEPNTPSGATVNFKGQEIRGAKDAFMPSVYFDFNSSTVSYANYERLASVAALLQANPSYTLKVIGYADSVGNSENNHKIALRRANAVIDALVNMFSVDASRLSAQSKGEDAPLANESVKVSETTSDGQVISNNLSRMNRRVEFVIE